MTKSMSTSMRAIAIHKFGGIEELKFGWYPIPQVDDGEILIRMEAAGVGSWDPFEREGGFAKKLGIFPTFPYVLGSDGSGTVCAVGEGVNQFKIGDEVYAFTQMTPKGGFYAEYAVAKADKSSLIPKGLSMLQAGAMPVDAMTALRGIDDTLNLKKGESFLVFGASGGVGHLAVQIAKRIGARVFAVVSGKDGIALANELGADVVICGRTEDIPAAARAFAPEGFDAALLTTGGKIVDETMKCMRDGARIAYPSGCREPAPQNRLHIREYSGYPDPNAISRLNMLIESGPFKVHISQTFTLIEAADAQRMLNKHYLGKIALLPR